MPVRRSASWAGRHSGRILQRGPSGSGPSRLRPFATTREGRSARPRSGQLRAVPSRPYAGDPRPGSRPPRRRRARRRRPPAAARPADRPRAGRRAARPGRALPRARPLGRVRDVRGVGPRPGRRGRRRDRPGRGAALPGRRQRRDREGGGHVPAVGQEGPPAPADRVPVPAAAGLPRRLGRRLPADAGRDLPRRGRLRPDLPEQRRALGRRGPAVRGDHGLVRRRRGLPAGALRHRPDDRGQPPLPGRPGPGEGGDRPGGRPRGARRRRDARRRQRHGRLQGARRPELPPPAPIADRHAAARRSTADARGRRRPGPADARRCSTSPTAAPATTPATCSPASPTAIRSRNSRPITGRRS